VAEIAAQISNDYKGKELDVICLLNGASIFCADLVRKITIPTRIHHLGFNSYSKPSDTGEVRVTLDIQEPMIDKNILIVEGLVISGRTPKYIINLFSIRQPFSIEICAIGIKRHLLSSAINVKYVAFEFKDENVVGYGIGAPNEKGIPYLFNKNSI
jgi:hypoxanthine phosphoribosyltransferase